MVICKILSPLLFYNFDISRKINTHAFLKINHDQYLMANNTGTDTAHSKFSEMSWNKNPWFGMRSDFWNKIKSKGRCYIYLVVLDF